jgi:hypothetical protein
MDAWITTYRSGSRVFTVLPGQLGKVEQHTIRGWDRVEHGTKQVTAAAADVSDRLRAPEVVRGQHCRDVGHRLDGHRLPENLILVRPALEIRPQAVRLNGFHRRRPASESTPHRDASSNPATGSTPIKSATTSSATACRQVEGTIALISV